MDRQGQISLLRRLLQYVDSRTTAMADAPWYNDVSVYSSPAHLAREQEVLFRRYPLLMGFAADWAEPGAFRTDDYAGVPILMARGQFPCPTRRAPVGWCRDHGGQGERR